MIQNANKDCRVITRAKAEYLDRLCKMKIFPYDLTFTEHRLCDLLKEMPDLNSIITCSTAGCQCRRFDITTRLPDNLNKQIRYIKDKQQNFNCLICFKNNDASHLMGSCQIDHTKPV